MAGTNRQTIRNAFKDFTQQVINTTRMELNKWCWEILEAAVQAREKDPNAHDFTGNLLNSIVVCLYEDGRPYAPYFASDIGVIPAKTRKMSFPKRYHFNSDYSGESRNYVPEVKTNEGWGRSDAERFFATYRCDVRNHFNIVVAYTTEYADWVEMQRGTTGILNTQKYALRTGMRLMQLKSS